MENRNPLDQVMTAPEIEHKFDLAKGTVRKYLSRHADELQERGELRKAGERTWLFLSATAVRIWGKSE